jgi:hypothetical protein
MQDPDILLLLYRYAPLSIFKHSTAARSFADLARKYNTAARMHCELFGAVPTLPLTLATPFSVGLRNTLFHKQCTLSVKFLPGALPPDATLDDAESGLNRMYSGRLPHIKHLDVSALPLGAVELLFCAAWRDIFRGVESLELGDGILQSHTVAQTLAREIPNAQMRLRQWDLSWTSPSNYGREIPDSFLFEGRDHQWAGLERLALRHVKLTPTSLVRITRHLLQRGAAETLQTLDLTGSRLSGHQFPALQAGLKQCSALRRLKLGRNAWFGYLGAHGLASVLPALSPCLQELDLSGSDLQDDGLVVLCGGVGQGLQELKVLRLGSNGITDKALAHLLALVQRVPRLQELGLEDNKIVLRAPVAGAFARFLAQQEELRAVDLRAQGGAVLSAGRLALRKAEKRLVGDGRRLVVSM